MLASKVNFKYNGTKAIPIEENKLVILTTNLYTHSGKGTALIWWLWGPMNQSADQKS